MATKATERRNGKRMVTIRVEAHLTANQAAVLLWHLSDNRTERPRLSDAYVRSAVAKAFTESGVFESWRVENDDDWEFNGGRDWALDQVMRVYGFTEADLDAEDRERRANGDA